MPLRIPTSPLFLYWQDDTCHSIISRWFLKLDVIKCLLNESYIGQREQKVLSIVRSSEKLISLVKTVGLFCGDICFQMSLGFDSFCYEGFIHILSVVGFGIPQKYSCMVQRRYKPVIYVSSARERGRYEHTQINYINILIKRNPDCRFKSQR